MPPLLSADAIIETSQCSKFRRNVTITTNYLFKGARTHRFYACLPSPGHEKTTHS